MIAPLVWRLWAGQRRIVVEGSSDVHSKRCSLRGRGGMGGVEPGIELPRTRPAWNVSGARVSE